MQIDNKLPTRFINELHDLALNPFGLEIKALRDEFFHFSS